MAHFNYHLLEVNYMLLGYKCRCEKQNQSRCKNDIQWQDQAFQKWVNLPVSNLKKKKKRRPKDTRVGSLCLLQWIFLTQELNKGLFTNWAIREAPTKNFKKRKKITHYQLFSSLRQTSLIQIKFYICEF